MTTDRTRDRGPCNNHQESKRGTAGLYRPGPRKAGRGRRPRRGRGGRGRGRAWREKSVVSVKELESPGASRASHPPTYYIQRNPLSPRLAYKAHTSTRFTYYQSPFPSFSWHHSIHLHRLELHRCIPLTTSVTLSTPQVQAQGPQKADYGNKTPRTSAHAQTRLQHLTHRPALEDAPRGC